MNGNKNYLFVTLLVSVLLMPSCVSNKKYAEMSKMYDASLERYNQLSKSCELSSQNLNADIANKRELISNYLHDLAAKDSSIQTEKNQNSALNRELNYMRESNNSLLSRMTDLAVISKTGAESIKQSLQAINNQSSYIRDLNKSIQSKDSLNMALILNLKRSLADINDEDVHIEVKKGVVYISLSDKMLYSSGSAEINSKAFDVLGKIAKVVNDHKNLDILVEGHTDNVPISTTKYADNWDLSTQRASAIVRVLQSKFNVEPERLTAAGRAQYVPKSDNLTAAGRQLNRRTEIILLPQLDQFFKLLEANSTDSQNTSK